MAIDSSIQPGSSAELDSSIIENEIPTYRAISARAVTSIILGLASVFCFTSLYFVLVAVASVLFGWAALRAIKRLPDILTGSSLAKTGIGLALVFSLTAATQALVEYGMIAYDATQFAKKYVEVLKSGPVAEAVWYKQSVNYRKEKNYQQAEDELKQAKSSSTPDLYGTEIAPVVAIKDQLKKPNAAIHFSKIESQMADGLTQYANVLGDIDSSDGEKFFLMMLIKEPKSRFGEWRIRELIYPYKPASTGLMKEKKADDGHGHSH